MRGPKKPSDFHTWVWTESDSGVVVPTKLLTVPSPGCLTLSSNSLLISWPSKDTSGKEMAWEWEPVPKADDDTTRMRSDEPEKEDVR